MAAPKNNQFWKLRSKHGREKIFSSPELLWDVACEYFEWCEAHPLLEVSVKGKDNTEVAIPKARPFTMRALCLYLCCNEQYVNQLELSLKGKHDNESKAFIEVLTRIRDVIYTQKFEGAAVGLFSYNIIARELGLTEKPDGRADDQPPATLQIQVLASSIPLAANEDDISHV